jgi:hypothetical protein
MAEAASGIDESPRRVQAGSSDTRNDRGRRDLGARSCFPGGNRPAVICDRANSADNGAST